jgi:hypothetical protein
VFLAQAQAVLFFAPWSEAMELVAIECGSLPPQWVIVRDEGSLFISSRTLARALEFKEARNLCTAFATSDHPPVDRSSFSADWLASAKDKNAHLFLRLSHLWMVLKPKYHQRLCDISGCISAYVARIAVKTRAPEGPRRASAAGSTERKERRISKTIVDVPMPPQDWVDPKAASFQQPVPILPMRLSFSHLATTDWSGSVASPAFPGRQSFPPPSDRVLRPTVPRSLDFEDSLAQPAQAPEDAERFRFEEEMHEKVLTRHGQKRDTLEKRPMMRLTESIRSKRLIDDVAACANKLGHEVTPLGIESGLGKFSWTVSLNVFGLTPSLKNALCFFGMVRTVEIRSMGASDQRQWSAQSEYLGVEDLQQLMGDLVEGDVPAPKLHPDFNRPLPAAFAEKHSWVLPSRGTSLSFDQPLLLSERLALVSETALRTVAAGCRCCRILCEFRLGGQIGLESQCEFVCHVCKKVYVIALFSGARSALNHTAYVAQMMSGRPKSISRFLELLGIGTIPKRESTRTFVDQLWRATESIYLECSDIMLQYIALSGNPTVGMDAFHKRMAKSFSVLGESYSTGISIADPRIHKVAHVFFTERRELDELRRKYKGEVRVPSPVAGKPELVTTLGGIEHASFDLALQAICDLFDAVPGAIHASKDLVEFAELLAQHFGDWKLASIVSDALSSAPNSVKKTFPTAEHFIDWWHRRASFKKEVAKAEAKKKDKKAQNPGFEGASVALGNVFSDCIYAKMTFEGFVAEVERLLTGAGVNVRVDDAHSKAWEKLMGKAEKMYGQTNIEMGSGVNELFHAHLRFFCLKGDAMSTTHWKIVVAFAFLSFNKFPNWQKRIADMFLQA